MKILLVHNYYGSSAPSGENQVFEAERAMLERCGETVEVYTRHSDEIRIGEVERKGGGGQRTCRFLSKVRKLQGLIKGAVCTVANPMAARALKKKIGEFKPDVVHFHNTFPLISPLAVRAAKKSGAKVVMTLHNYRMVCAAGVPTRGNRVCDACFRKVKVKGEGERRTLNVISALRNRCYRGSLLATVPLALNIALYRKWWAKWVDTFIVLSEFQKKVLIECGLPEEKIVIKGNFVGGGEYGPRSSFFLSGRGITRGEAELAKQVARGVTASPLSGSGEDTASPLSGQRRGAVFVGRLSDEKGVKTLLKAWATLQQSNNLNNPNNPNNLNNPNNRTILTLIGDGDQRAEYEELAKGMNVQFLGKVPHERVLEELSAAKCMIQPSECWETFGLTVVEAASVGTPAVVSDVGAFPGIVKTLGAGEVVATGDAAALAAAIGRMLARKATEEEAERLRRSARENYSEAANLKKLLEIYDS